MRFRSTFTVNLYQITVEHSGVPVSVCYCTKDVPSTTQVDRGNNTVPNVCSCRGVNQKGVREEVINAKFVVGADGRIKVYF